MNIEILDDQTKKKLESLRDAIGSLTIDELFTFKKLLVEKYPIFDTSKLNINTSTANIQSETNATDKKQESFEIVLEAIEQDPRVKAKVIVAVREILGLQLMQAKAATETLPCVLVKGAKTQQELEDLRSKYFKGINVTLSLKKSE